MSVLEKAVTEGSRYPEFSNKLALYETSSNKLHETILYKEIRDNGIPSLTIRQAGERMILLDYGIEKFSLFNCGRQRELELKIRSYDKNSKFQKSLLRVETCSGAMGVTFNTQIISRSELLNILIELEKTIPSSDRVNCLKLFDKFKSVIGQRQIVTAVSFLCVTSCQLILIPESD